MPSPTTALQIIEDALGLTNAVGVDQTLTADEVSDSLRVFNDLLEVFSLNNLAVYGQADQTFNTVAGTDVYTIGVGGTWNTVRPVRINDPAYSVVNGTSFPLVSITQAEYAGISNKAQTQGYPDYYFYVNDYPLGIITLWPVPSAIVPLTFNIDRVLTAVTDAAATLSYPPGYAQAFKYKLAIMLAPTFGKKISNYPDVQLIANQTFGDICRVNQIKMPLQLDPSLGGGSGQSRLAVFLAG
jgi:hypothetical protein